MRVCRKLPEEEKNEQQLSGQKKYLADIEVRAVRKAKVIQPRYLVRSVSICAATFRC